MKSNFSIQPALLTALCCFSLTLGAQGLSCSASFVFQTGTNGGVYFMNNSSSANTGISSSWDFGDGSSSTDMNPFHAYANAGTYNVCLTIAVTTPNGVVCTDTKCEAVTVGQIPPPCIDPTIIDHNLACITLYDPVCGCDGVTYSNDCVAKYHHGVTSWTQGACPGTTTCQASFTFQPNHQTLEVHFTNTSTNSNTANFSASWDFGDNTLSNDISPAHTYQSAGTYNVCLTITTAFQDGSVCTDTHCESITVGNNFPGCQANFTYTIDPSGLGVQFTDNSLVTTATYATNWDFGDGTTSTDFNPFHAYQSAGTYHVCLILFAPVSGLGCVDTICKTIVLGQNTNCIDPNLINVNCVCPAIYAPVCGCDGVTYGNDCEAQCHGVTRWTQGPCPNQGCSASFTFTHTQSGLGVQFTNTSTGNTGSTAFTSDWDFGDGTTSTDKDPQHTYTAAGVYYVCLKITVITPNGVICTDTHCDSVRVGQNHSCVDPSVIDLNVTCFAMGMPGVYCGCDGNTYASQCEAYYHHGVTSGSWSLNGQCGGTSGCQASFNYQGDPTTLKVYFNNTSFPNNATASWDFGDNTTSTDFNPTHFYQSAGTYYVCLTITAPNSVGAVCTSTFCDSVKVGVSSPCINVTMIPVSCLCPQVYDPVCGCDGVTYSNSCMAQCAGVTHWTQGPCQTGGCQASFTFLHNSSVLGGQFTNTSTPPPVPGTPYYSHWDFGDGTTSTDMNPQHTFPAAGAYYVCLTISVPTSNGNVCTSTFCDSVRVGQNTPCIDPALMNPNCICPAIYAPVCGCDGVTYGNDCEARCHGVTRWTQGPCNNNGNCAAKFLWNYGIVPPTIFFTDISTGGNIIGWHWDFGDGTTSNDQNPSHDYQHPGTYVVCLTISCATSATGLIYTDTWCDTIHNASGCVDPTLIDPNHVCPAVYEPVCGCNGVTYYNSCAAHYQGGVTAWTVGPCQNTGICDANFSFQVTSHSNTVQFTNLSTGPATDFYWDFGDGGFSTDKNPLHNYNHSGRYYVCLKITGPQNCFDTFCDSIYIPGCVDVSLINNNSPCPIDYQPVCGCDSITYPNACIARKRHGVTSWTPGPCHNHCQANFTFAYPLNGNQILFFDNSTGNYTRVKWDFGDGTFSNDKNPVHLYEVTGWYYVCLTINNPNGSCYSVYCDSVFANGCHDPSLIDPTVACPTIYQPVCGCDGITYQNACEAHYRHGITLFTQGACPAANYCTTSGQDQHSVWIKRVGANITGDDGGYAHFDFCHRTYHAGRTYTLRVAGATNATVNFQAHWRMWWDFNHDFDFDDPGELVWQGFGALTQFAVFTVPHYACSGCTRMRITLSNDFQDACGNYAVGETEDYDLTLRSNVLCAPVNSPLALSNPHSLKTGEATELDEEFMEEYVPVSFNLFPNPAQDNVNVQISLSEEAQKVTVQLLDISGKQIFTQSVSGLSNNVSLQIQTSDVTNGIYQVIVSTDKGFKEIQKLIIAR